MLKNRKFILLWVLVFTLSTGIVGCNSTKKNSEVQNKFDAYMKEIPTETMSSDDLNLEFLFKNPQDFGFEEELLELPFTLKEEYNESNQEAKELIAELEKFSYDDLTSSQQLTYDVLKDSLNRSLLDEKFYYLDNNYLGSFIGFQAQLPLLLSEYTFERQNDLDSYFHILETSPEVFKKYADNEKERQKHGVGMSQSILNKVIQQCSNFIKDKDVFLIEDINKKIDQIDFLNGTQKADAKKKNEYLLKNKYLYAYEVLKKELSTIEGKDKDVGLSQLPNGKEYYEFLIKKNTGLDDSIKDVKKYLEDKSASISMEMMKLVSQNPGIIDNFDFKKIKYSSFTSFEQNINYLSEQIQKDYPKTAPIQYNVRTVPDAMKDNFSPAAYLQGKIDADNDEKEQIWVNGEFNQNLFMTIAHEGYPGHMYQHVYFKRQQLPTVRYLLDYNGYIEGWATYIENNSYQYIDVSNKQDVELELSRINSQLTQNMMCQIDIGIHYDGWSYEDYKSFMKDNFGNISENDLKEQYDLFIETPTNYIQYYLTAMKFQDLRDKAQKELGDKFKATDFHKVILETGPSSFNILEKQVDKLIKNTK